MAEGVIGRGSAEEPLAAGATAGSQPMVAAGLGRAAAREALDRRHLSPLWISLVVFFVYTIPLGALLWAAIRGSASGRLYLLIRPYAVALPWLLVTIEAFREGFLAGLACLFVPGYVVVYSLRRVERAWMRYLILGALGLLAAEYLWWQERSLVVWLSTRLEAFRERVAYWLRHTTIAPSRRIAP